MVERGDWLTPHYNYEPRFQKPILFYWLVAGTYAVAGIGETQARLWAALSGVGLALVVPPPGGAGSTRGPRSSRRRHRRHHVRVLFDRQAGASRSPAGLLHHARGLRGAGRHARRRHPCDPLVASCRRRRRMRLPHEGAGRGGRASGGAHAGLDRSSASGSGSRCSRALGAIAVALGDRRAVVHRDGRSLTAPAIWRASSSATTSSGSRQAASTIRGPLWFYLPIVLGGMLPWTPLVAVIAPMLRTASARRRVAVTAYLADDRLGRRAAGVLHGLGRQAAAIHPAHPAAAGAAARRRARPAGGRRGETAATRWCRFRRS